jgi:hypothetical protein
MKLTEKQIATITEDLCDYDKRNPLYDSENEKSKGDCYCDNCFYGRTKLAEIILLLLEISQNEIHGENTV